MTRADGRSIQPQSDSKSGPPSGLTLTAADVYGALVRSLRRRKGFGIVFVQCTPAEAEQLLPRLRSDIPQKCIERLKLDEPIDNLYARVAGRTDLDRLNILLIQGLEKSLEADIKPGYAGDGDYYNRSSVPRILAHLNQQRDAFRDDFPGVCLVFLLPVYATKYFIRRAPDFFDWGAGVFELPTDERWVAKAASEVLQKTYFDVYLGLSQAERDRKLLEIEGLLAEAYLDKDQFCSLLREQGRILSASNQHTAAIASFDKALELKPDHHKSWFNRGVSLGNLGRYEEAIASYDQALELKPDFHEAWTNRGNSLVNLGRTEEAIASYEKALEIKPDDPDRAIQLGLTDEVKHNNRGLILLRLQRFAEAQTSFEAALTLEVNYPDAHYGLACTYALSGQPDLALNHLARAIQLDPEHYRALAQSDRDFDSLCQDPRFQSLLQEHYQISTDNP